MRPWDVWDEIGYKWGRSVRASEKRTSHLTHLVDNNPSSRKERNSHLLVRSRAEKKNQWGDVGFFAFIDSKSASVVCALSHVTRKFGNWDSSYSVTLLVLHAEGRLVEWNFSVAIGEQIPTTTTVTGVGTQIIQISLAIFWSKNMWPQSAFSFIGILFCRAQSC